MLLVNHLNHDMFRIIANKPAKRQAHSKNLFLNMQRLFNNTVI